MNNVSFEVVRTTSLDRFREECNALLASGGAPSGSMSTERDGFNTYYTQAFIVPGENIDKDPETLVKKFFNLSVIAGTADDICLQTNCNVVLAWKLAECVHADEIALADAFTFARS